MTGATAIKNGLTAIGYKNGEILVRGVDDVSCSIYLTLDQDQIETLLKIVKES